MQVLTRDIHSLSRFAGTRRQATAASAPLSAQGADPSAPLDRGWEPRPASRIKTRTNLNTTQSGWVRGLKTALWGALAAIPFSVACLVGANHGSPAPVSAPPGATTVVTQAPQIMVTPSTTASVNNPTVIAIELTESPSNVPTTLVTLAPSSTVGAPVTTAAPPSTTVETPVTTAAPPTTAVEAPSISEAAEASAPAVREAAPAEAPAETVPPEAVAPAPVEWNWQTKYSPYDLAQRQLHSNDCGVTAAQALLRAHGYDADHETLFDDAISGGFHAGRGPHKGWNGPYKMVDYLGTFGLQARMEAFNRENIDSELMQGKPIIVSTERHYFVISGIDEQGNLIAGATGEVVGMGPVITYKQLKDFGGAHRIIVVDDTSKPAEMREPAFPVA